MLQNNYARRNDERLPLPETIKTADSLRKGDLDLSRYLKMHVGPRGLWSQVAQDDNSSNITGIGVPQKALPSDGWPVTDSSVIHQVPSTPLVNTTLGISIVRLHFRTC
jgi:hypothetical protein